MNIFKQYGLREVADVTFFSINRVGDEEFYTPVLFFDTLKVSSLDKSITTVNNSGGKGNGKIVSWSFNKDLKLRLEDALFSEMSLNTFLNGRVTAKMAAWTSAIAKLNVANKYGQKNYSVMAYPSPELTEEEWEIVYRCAQKAGFDPKTGYTNEVGKVENDDVKAATSRYILLDNMEDNKGVYENRYELKDRYYKRLQKTPHPRDLSSFLDYNAQEYESVNVILKDIKLDEELEQAKEIANLKINEQWGGYREVIITYRKREEEKREDFNKMVSGEEFEEGEGNLFRAALHFAIKKTPAGHVGLWAYLSGTSHWKRTDNEENNILDIFTGHSAKEKIEGAYSNSVIPIGNQFFLNHILYYLFPHYLEDAISDLCWCDLRDKIYPAMPHEIIDEIAEEIDNFNKVGYFENDLFEARVIDRFEKCVVKNRKGLTIDLVKQTENLKKMYNNDQSSFCVFYDEKTMLPFMQHKVLDKKILDQKCVQIKLEENMSRLELLEYIKGYLKEQYDQEWIDSLTEKDFEINKITEKFGRLEGQSWVEKNGMLYIDTDGNIQRETIGNYNALLWFTITKRDFVKLKKGTVYYKWSRTIDEDVNEETFLGENLSIDADTFSGEYLILGETLVRDQQTGKDSHCLFKINRATISASTKIDFKADGEPSTFSIDVDVLMPFKTKAQIELIKFNVEEDKTNGGLKIVPQNKKHAYTSTIDIEEQIIQKNVEIY